MPSRTHGTHAINPFTQPGHWFKGSIHIHSTASDGELTPDEVTAWYRDRGYRFLALTDHRVLSEAHSLADGFIALSGIEWDGIDQEAGLYHLVGLGLQRSPELNGGEQVSMQEAANQLRAAGGLVCLAHPYWSGQMSKDLLPLEGCFGLEIYNGGCEVDDAKGMSTVHWDDLLASGRRLWGVAVDDAHWREGSKDAGLGWVWVKAPELTPAAILGALDVGCFYASSGPEIHDLRFDASRDELSVRCSPAVRVDFVGSAWHSHRLTALPGRTLTEASYQIKQGQKYVRVACQDARGSWAWSNPLFLGYRK